MTADTLLEVRGLTVSFTTRFGEFTAVEGIDLSVAAGSIHGLVGESGAGKSTIGAAIMGLLPTSGRIAAGSVTLAGLPLQDLDDAAWHRLRGSRVSMIFQDPQTSLNPLIRIGDQLVETIRQHADIDEDDARRRAIALLDETGIHDAATRIDDYPHQFSGGMRQRVVIALALCTDPELIIADEPTTALDVAVQQQILDLLKRLVAERQIGVILITHDIGVIVETSDRVTVLRHGRVVESGPTQRVLGSPAADYTRALMAAVPRMETRLPRFRGILDDVSADLAGPDVRQASVADGFRVTGASAELASDWLLRARDDAGAAHDVTRDGALLEIDELSVTFGARGGGWFGIGRRDGVQALRNVTLSLAAGTTLGVVGESGSGKSTLAKAITGLVDPSSGAMRFDAATLPPGGTRRRDHASRRRIQLIFQDPYASLDSRFTVERILAEPVRHYGHATNRSEVRRLVASMLELVEMPQSALRKYPHQFSGGQRQRVAVARALLARPELLIADEPTSALDVSVQAQILNLLRDLQDSFGLSMLFISHDLAVVRQIADTVAVLKDGDLVEFAPNERFFAAAEAPYSRYLLSETPSLAGLDGGTVH